MRRLGPMAAAAGLFLGLSGCGEGGGGNAAADGDANEAVLTGEDQLTADPSVADEAAADEAADMNLYGGNAAAGETGNGADAAPAAEGNGP